MYVEYSKIGDKVFAKDENDNIKSFDNTDNIFTIIKLENEKCSTDKIIEKERMNKKKYTKYRNVFLGLTGVYLTNAIINSVNKQNNYSYFAISGAIILFSFVPSFIMQKISNTYDSEIKNLKIYKKVLEKELKYQLFKGKKVKSEENERGYINNNANMSTYYKWDFMRNELINDYRINRKITIPIFDENEKNIVELMVDETIKNNAKKVKVKEI